VPACVYAEHNGTALLCLGWQLVGEQQAQSWAPGDNDTRALNRLHRAIAAGADVHAWNSPFDAAVWNAVRPDWPPIALEQQHDVAARAAMCGLPRGLEKAAAALGVDMAKDKKGLNALRYLMRPRSWPSGAPRFADDPARLALVRTYCKQDIAILARLHALLPALPDEERAIWLHDQRVNESGFRIDPEFVAVAGPFFVKALRDGDARMREATDGAVKSVSSVQALGAWLEGRGVDLAGLDREDTEPADEDEEEDATPSRKGQLSKAGVRALLERPTLPPEAREALETRQDYGRPSASKIVALTGAMSPDGRLRGSLLYHGTLTGRQTAKLFQPQNLPRDSYSAEQWPAVLDDMRTLDPKAFRKKYGKPDDPQAGSPMAALARLLRGTIVPTEGCELAIGDFATVELRVLAWLAGQADLVAALASGAKVYEAMAARIYQVPIETIGRGTSAISARRPRWAAAMVWAGES
jgi:DNA polymerase